MKFAGRRFRFLLALPAAAAGCLALAADENSDRLLKLRSQWRGQVARDTHDLRAAYAQKLGELEKGLVTRRDYQTAAEVRALRLSVNDETAWEKTLATAPEKAVPDNPIVLELMAARLSGGPEVKDTDGGILTGFKSAGAAARWRLPAGLPGGGYEVELTYAAPRDAGGEFVVKEDFYGLRRTVTPTAGWEDYQTKVVGTLRLLTNSRFLDLSAAMVRGAELFRLKSVRLIPVAADK